MKLPPTSALLASAILVWASARPLMAAPANDNLASLQELPPSGPATPGSNVGATLESNEPLPAGYTAQTYGATVWYGLELATADATWYIIETTGSQFDTVLSVWGGDDFEGPLSLVHVNDEAAEGGISRIRFLASAFTVHKVAVAGKGAAQQGPLAIRAVADTTGPFSVLNAAVVTPTVNVTSVAATVTATLNLSSSAEIASGSFVLMGAGNTVVATVPFSGANRTSGNVATGTYQVSATIPQGSPAGTYRWKVAMTSTGSFPSSTSYGWEALSPLPPGATQTITVQNTAAVNTYGPWASSNGVTGPNSGPAEDFDSDGLANLTEFAFGLNPHQPFHPRLVRNGSIIAQPGLPHISVVGTGNQRRLRVEYVRRVNDASLTYIVQFGSDLATWSNATGTAAVVASDGTLEVVAMEDVVFNPAKSRRFARVQVVR